MAARKTITHSQSPHTYIVTNKTKTESVGPSTYMHSRSSTSLLKSVVSFTTTKKKHMRCILQQSTFEAGRDSSEGRSNPIGGGSS